MVKGDDDDIGMIQYPIHRQLHLEIIIILVDVFPINVEFEDFIIVVNYTALVFLRDWRPKIQIAIQRASLYELHLFNIGFARIQSIFDRLSAQRDAENKVIGKK